MQHSTGQYDDLARVPRARPREGCRRRTTASRHRRHSPPGGLSAMPHVVIDRAVADGASLENEIARLRGLDVGKLRARWHTIFRRVAPPHLPRHLLFRILAYRLQADQFGDLDADIRRVLDRMGFETADGFGRLVADLIRSRTELRPGTLLTREWSGH